MMVTNFGGLAALTLLTGSSSAATFASSMPTVLSKAQRKAKAAFTTPDTTAPWRLETPVAATSAQANAIKAMRSIIDKPTSATSTLPVDVQTSFATYRALDRLRVLAEAASKDTTGSAERAKLQTAFGKGLVDLQNYLTNAPSEKVNLAFGRASKEVTTIGIASPSALSAATIKGTGVRETRDGPLAGVTGNEVLRIDLSQPGGTADTFTIDLSQTPQPPTLDSVSDAVNAAISAIPRRDNSGNIVRDANGDVMPRWSVKVEPDKFGDKWGLSIKRAGFETISIDQVGAGDALMVAAGTSAEKAPAQTRLTRFDDPTGTLTRKTLSTITATDADATARSKLAYDADKTGKLKAETIAADTAPGAIATDAQGFSYVIGTTSGDMGANLSNGADDLFLTKVDSEGTVVWKRNLGAAGSAQGAAVSIAPDGGIVVAGTVTGSFDGSKSDGDMMVARYDANGNEQFSTLIRAVGQESASAVTVGADGSIFVGGADAKGAAIVARLDGTGKLVERRTIDGTGTDRVRALATDANGGLVMLASENGRAVVRRLDGANLSAPTTTLDLGRADARALAIGTDGTIAVAGGADTALVGAQVNAIGARRDAFVARIDAALSGASVTYLGTDAEDQADSVAFMGSKIYVGGRTSGALAGAKTGMTDAFVARVDGSTGAIGDVRQYGTVGETAGTVQLSAIKGGNSVLGALGLHRGTMTPTDSVSLTAQTSLRVGDEFSIRVNGGPLRKIVVGEKDTLTTLGDKVRKFANTRVANVLSWSKDGGRALRIDVKAGNRIELIAGAEGKDALAKLGLEPRRLVAAPAKSDDTPKVTPGGSFGLDLSDAIQIGGKDDARIALKQVQQAISFTQSAYRSLYWDDVKAAMADDRPAGRRTGASTAVEQAQRANYEAALNRLSGGSTINFGF